MSLQELLGKSTADIDEEPVLDGPDAARVPRELRSVLSKMQFALRMQLTAPFSVLTGVIRQAAQVASGAEQMTRMVEDNDVRHLLTEVLTEGIESHTLNVLELVQRLCGAPRVKETVFPALLPKLLKLLPRDDSNLSRQAATTVIFLISGSKENKRVLKDSIVSIVKAITASTDFFFQVQCVEMLFRLHTHNPSALSQAWAPGRLLEGLRVLPNDIRLLDEMQRLVLSFNAALERADMCSFEALGVACSGREVCGPTTVHFSSSTMQFFFPRDNTSVVGEQLTLALSSVRSMRVSKDQKLSLKLGPHVPQRIAAFATTAGEVELQLQMTHGTLQRLQKSSVPRWVLAAKKFAEAAETDEHARKRLRADDGADAKLAGRHINELRSNVERQPPEDEAAEAFEQLQRAIHDKVRRQQEVQREAVRTRVDEAQRIVDEMKLVNARERDNFETENRRAIENVAAADCAQKEVVAVAVHELNQELIRMQEAGEAVQLQIGRCAVLLAEAIDGAAELEISSLAALKAMVDEEIWLVQKAVAAAIEKENPMRYLTKYLDGEK